ncbi:MAG: mandelate racemase/muconate lactonizing enzyme family protein [Myxococcota bacterium]
MRIDRIDLWHVEVPLRGAFYPSWIPGFPQTENRFTLIRLRTASGLEGWSAGSAMGREREGIGSLLGPYLLGERADDVAGIRQRLREMSYLGLRLGWIEAACWDVIGKARALPVWRVLAPDAPTGGEVKLYRSSGQVRSGTDHARYIEEALRQGFDTVKLRVHAATLEEDLRAMREARQAVVGAVRLGVDANQAWRVAVVDDVPAWTHARALTFCNEMHQLGFDWVEEPLAMDDYDGLAKLRAATEVDLTGGELNNQGLPEFGVMLEKRCYDVYQPDAVFTGGIGETWQIIQRVKAAGARYTPHTWTNGIGFAINLQLYAASPWRADSKLEYPDDGAWAPEARDGLLVEPFLHRGGKLALPMAPGLGFAIDERQLKRHGHHFFTATKLRMSLAALRDKGLKTALELGARRDARLAQRSAALDAMAARGEDPVTEGTSGER